MMNKPELELVLGVRSYENVVVLSSPDSKTEYPETWIRAARGDVSDINGESVVVIDRVDVQRKTLSFVGQRQPRIVAMVPDDLTQEKAMRRLLSSTYPWAESWTVFTTFGKVIFSADVRGAAYERDDIIDWRVASLA